MKVFHILNGDALTDRFLQTELSGEVIVMRECLIEGPLDGDDLSHFLETRSRYISNDYRGDYSIVKNELDKILNSPSPAEFNLWFGYDLFCQANLWFLLSLIQGLSIDKKVSIVYPSYLRGVNVWEEFGPATKRDLIISFQERIELTFDDIQLGNQLWSAYQMNDLIKLRELSLIKSKAFPYLKEICEAHIQRFDKPGRPQKVITEIIQTSSSDFGNVFKEFWKREGIYGFGDSQLRKIYDEVIS